MWLVLAFSPEHSTSGLQLCLALLAVSQSGLYFAGSETMEHGRASCTCQLCKYPLLDLELPSWWSFGHHRRPLSFTALEIALQIIALYQISPPAFGHLPCAQNLGWYTGCVHFELRALEHVIKNLPLEVAHLYRHISVPMNTHPFYMEFYNPICHNMLAVSSKYVHLKTPTRTVWCTQWCVCGSGLHIAPITSQKRTRVQSHMAGFVHQHCAVGKLGQESPPPPLLPPHLNASQEPWPVRLCSLSFKTVWVLVVNRLGGGEEICNFRLLPSILEMLLWSYVKLGLEEDIFFYYVSDFRYT